MKKRKYKALVLDLDGTTIPNAIEGMPSIKVTNAVRKASKLIHVGIATSRPLNWATHIIEHLDLSSPCIIDGGAQIYDPRTKKILWEQPLEIEDVYDMFEVSVKQKCQFNISDGDSHDITKKEEIPQKVLDVFFKTLTQEQSDEIIEIFSKIPTVSVHRLPAWGSGVPPINITHAQATKQHGILKVAEVLKIETHSIIGVGDGYNDFPLLMACGLKVAMGNAVPELKEIADYVAPSVEEDGVAEVIKRFVLKA